MKLHDAYNLAEKIKDVLAPFCEVRDGRPMIEVAGSIRRARPEVNDIDFVVLPKDGQADALRARCLRTATMVKSGPQYTVVKMNKAPYAQVDIWFAHNGAGDMFTKEPSNWGSLLLCRTGSREHNVHLCQLAQSLGLKWETSRGLVTVPSPACPTGRSEGQGEGGRIIASATEEEIFQALGLSFIPPVERERNAPLSHAAQESPDWSQAFSTVDDPTSVPIPSDVSTAAGDIINTINHAMESNPNASVIRIPGAGGMFINRK